MWQFNFAGFFRLFRITKCAKVVLLQSATDCYYNKYVRYYNLWRTVNTKCVMYYKVWQTLLQRASSVTKCYSYYKVGYYLLFELFKLWFHHDLHNFHIHMWLNITLWWWNFWCKCQFQKVSIRYILISKTFRGSLLLSKLCHFIKISRLLFTDFHFVLIQNITASFYWFSFCSHLRLALPTMSIGKVSCLWIRYYYEILMLLL